MADHLGTPLGASGRRFAKMASIISVPVSILLFHVSLQSHPPNGGIDSPTPPFESVFRHVTYSEQQNVAERTSGQPRSQKALHTPPCCLEKCHHGHINKPELGCQGMRDTWPTFPANSQAPVRSRVTSLAKSTTDQETLPAHTVPENHKLSKWQCEATKLWGGLSCSVMHADS